MKLYELVTVIASMIISAIIIGHITKPESVCKPPKKTFQQKQVEQIKTCTDAGLGVYEISGNWYCKL